MRYMLDHALRVAWLSEAYLLAGRLDEAYTQAQHALEFSRPIRNGPGSYALRLLGEIHARRSSRGRTRCNPLPPGPRPGRGLGMRPLQRTATSVSTVYQDRPAGARAELSMAIGLYRAMDMHFWLPQAEAALAQTDGAGPV